MRNNLPFFKEWGNKKFTQKTCTTGFQWLNIGQKLKEKIKQLYRNFTKKYHLNKAIKKQRGKYNNLNSEINAACQLRDKKLKHTAERAEKEEKIRKTKNKSYQYLQRLSLC